MQDYQVNPEPRRAARTPKPLDSIDATALTILIRFRTNLDWKAKGDRDRGNLVQFMHEGEVVTYDRLGREPNGDFKVRLRRETGATFWYTPAVAPNVTLSTVGARFVRNATDEPVFAAA